MPPSSRAFSPPASTISSAQGNSSHVHIKKVAIEGRSKYDGASLRIYLKFSVVVDNVSPGASIVLFREDNLRIMQSKVHPLDENSIPYYFSSTEQPLLHKAAIALQLGTKSSRHYNTLFPTSSPPMEPTFSRRNREGAASTSATPPTDERYTGFILVSGYNVTLVLPREFPPKTRSIRAGSDGEDAVKDVPMSWSARSARRPSVLSHKTYLHMMAALDVFVPYVTTPPKGPFLISIPVPRCLDNYVKLRISTPSTNSPPSIPRGSFTSTSSEDESPGWDFLTDPPVSRKIDKSLRKSPYQQSADDESDSPSGSSVPGTELIQGAYQSTEVLHVCWAPPLGKRSGIQKTEDGMRRVGIEWTGGKMKCEILGREAQGIKLGVNYDATCNGLWHPGVATVVGMDIALDVRGRRVSWPDGAAGWTVSGGNGFGGLHSEARPTAFLGRKPSFESTTSTPFLSTLGRSSLLPTASSASLLRVPLPNQNTQEYSFESLPSTTQSIGAPPVEPALNTSEQDTKLSNPDVPPGKSVMLKVNLLKLLQPTKSIFEFSVRGVIIIDVEDEDFVPLPMFRVLGSDKERVETTIAMQTADASIKMGTENTDGPKRILRLGEEMRCEDSFGLVLTPLYPHAVASSSTAMPTKHKISPRSQLRTHSPHPKLDPLRESVSSAHRSELPCVLSTVTPLPHSGKYTHCVRVNIPSYSLEEDTIEFTLTLPSRLATTDGTATTVEVLYASYAGRYVQAEALSLRDATFRESDSVDEKQVITDTHVSVTVHLGDVEVDSGDIEVLYLIGEAEMEQTNEDKGKAKEELAVEILLPCFQRPISRYEVEIDCPTKFDPQVKYSTLPNEHTTHSKALKLSHYVMPAGFSPDLHLSLLPSYEVIGKRSRTRRVIRRAWYTLPNFVALVLLYLVISMGSEVRQVRETLNAAARAFFGGVSFGEGYWADRADSPGTHWGWGWSPDQILNPGGFGTTATTVPTVTTSTTSWEKETLSPSTPTIHLSEATPVHEKRPTRPPRTPDDRSRMSLIPLPAMPLLSWQIPLSAETRDIVMKGFWRVVHLLRRIIEFPLDPD